MRGNADSVRIVGA
jgi:hypothetical protein